jgi:hypothetical protein
MTKQDRQRLVFLMVLLVVLGFTLAMGNRISRSPDTAAVQAPERKGASAAPTQTDARIRLDLLDRPEGSETLGKNNLFQYRTRAANAKTSGASAGSQPPQTSPPLAIQTTPTRPTGPPPPPPIALKYRGFAYVDPDRKALTGFIGDDTRHFNAVEGEVLMGKYRITRITESAIELEDLEFNRRQTLPLTTQ